MKNIKKTIVLSLSLVGAFTLCEEQIKKVPFNKNSITDKVKQTAGTLIDVGAGTVNGIKTLGSYCDYGLMSMPYGIGYFFRGIGSGIKIIAGYTMQAPFRMIGNGIDGLFGQGTVEKMGSFTKGGLTLGVGGLAAVYAYKGLNGLAKKLIVSDIKSAFELGGSKDRLGSIKALEYKKNYENKEFFYNALAHELKKRFEATDFYAYIKDHAKDYVTITTVFEELNKLIESALANTNVHAIEFIVSQARKEAFGGFFGFGKLHLFNGYCKELLELYAKIVVAKNIAEKKNQLTHEQIVEMINKNKISSDLLNN